jgi:ABC-2 type transport system ATP-binding protein
MRARQVRGNIVAMTEARELPKSHDDERETLEADVLVRCPRRGALTRVLTAMGATVLAEPDGALSVTGLEAWRIAAVAAENYLPIQELTPRRGSSESS